MLKNNPDIISVVVLDTRCVQISGVYPLKLDTT